MTGRRLPPAPRVLVTGIGLRTSLGDDRETCWRRLREGAHGARTLDIDPGPGGPAFAGFPLRAVTDQNDLTAGVASEALRDAFPDGGPPDPDRVATVIGTSKGDVRRLAGALARQAPGVGPDWLDAWPHGASARVAARFDFRGPLLAPVAACATGLVAALRGADLIRQGVCDLAVVGAADASLHPLLLGAFRRMGVLAPPGDDPGRAVRPWDRSRSGFLVGEGAAVLVLERDDRARARGALPYAELAGGALGADAFHPTDLDPDPSNLAGLIGRALAASGTDPGEVDHVNVHGTATRVNDPLECGAVRRALGARAGRVACSANKGQIGHLLGAAGAVELAFTALAVRDGFAPPTRNLDDPDPRCDLDGTPHVGRALEVRAALKLSVGFGGHLAAAVLRRPDAPARGEPGR